MRGGQRAVQRSGNTWRLGGRGLAIQESRGLPRCSAFNSSTYPQGRRTLRSLTFGVVYLSYFYFYFTPQSWGRTTVGLGRGMVIRLDMAKCGSTHGRPPTKSTVAAGFGSVHSSPPSVYVPFPLFPLLSLLIMFTINPYDRFVSDTSPSSENTPSRRRISFSLKAAPVVSITTASATSTGQENRSPTNCIPFPSAPLQIHPTPTCHDAMYVPFPDDLLSAPEPMECTPSSYVHRRQRSHSGLMDVQQSNPRPLSTLNSESRASVGRIDLGKATAVLSITSSGAVSRVDSDHMGKTLATARQRRLQYLDRKRNGSMVTKKQTKKASMDAKFLITLHHSITWHIENRSDAKGRPFFQDDLDRDRFLTIGKSRPSGSRELDAQDGLLAQRILQHLTQKGQIFPPVLKPEVVHADEALMYHVPVTFPASDDVAAPCPRSPSPAPTPGPGIMTMPQIVAALHLKHRDRATKSPRPRSPVARKVPVLPGRSPLSQLC